MSQTPHQSARAAMAAIATITASATIRPASADLDGYYSSPSDYAISLSHMPDFDQRRRTDIPNGILGLANDGNMYCVPTSVLNVGAYLGIHGHPDAFPGNANWQSQAEYNEVSLALALLGVLGNTSPTGGTNLNGMHTQMQYVVPLNKFTVSTHGFSGVVGPSPTQFAQWAINGSVLATCHGWYEQIGSSSGIPILQRNGGHCLTYNGSSNSLFDQTISLRDPADSSGLFTQSPFNTRTYDWEPMLYFRNGAPKIGTRILASANDGAIRVLDGYSKVTPKMGVSLTPFVPDTSITITIAPGAFGVPSQTILVPNPAESIVEDVVFGPDNDRVYGVIAAADGSRLITCTRIHDPEWQIFENVPLPGPQQLLIADDRTLLSVGGGSLTRFLVDVGPGDEPDVIGERAVPERAVIQWDAASQRIVLFDPNVAALSFISTDLAEASPPLFADMDSIDGEVSMAWDHTRGSAWIVKPGSDALLRLIPQPELGKVDVVSLTLQPGLVPVSVGVDDLGHVLVSDGERWHEFAQNDFGGWVPAQDSFFDEMAVGRRPSISRSRTNWNDVVFPPEEWINVLPEDFAGGIVDCPADLDGDGEVGFGDVLNLLAAWGACPAGSFCEPDLDVSGVVGFPDLLILLADFGDCG
ncbi:MAG: hypothetical protein AB8G96_05750 [Phycisphaerales bacterium]